VESDGRGTSKRKEHMHEVSYTDAEGNPATRMGIRYNPWLKTKLFVLATSFLRAGVKDNPYREIYDNYKHRLQNSANWKDRTDGNRHRAALRYMVKMFILDLYHVWRKFRGVASERALSRGEARHEARRRSGLSHATDNSSTLYRP
jgi:hypothetical protein